MLLNYLMMQLMDVFDMLFAVLITLFVVCAARNTADIITMIGARCKQHGCLYYDGYYNGYVVQWELSHQLFYKMVMMEIDVQVV